MTNNPFASQTATNTGDFNKKVADDYGDIKVDFGSLHGYALNMLHAAMNLMKDAGSIYQIPQMNTQAFLTATGGVIFKEGILANLFVSTNFKDLVSMLSDLQVGLMNIANAAQTVSDSYGLTDDGSRDDLNRIISTDAVDFAFGMGGKRPPGLPSNIGTTWLEQKQNNYNEANNNLAAVTNASDPSQMGGTVSVSYETPYPGEPTTKITTITYPDGSSIKIETTTAWDGTVYTDYSAVDASGKTTTSNRQITATSGGTTTVTYQQPDKNGTYQTTRTQATSTTNHPDGTSVTTTTTSTVDNGKSTPSSTTSKTTNTDGSTDTTTVQHNSDGTDTTTHSAVGSNSDDVSDQQGYDPKKYADQTYTKAYVHPTNQ